MKKIILIILAAILILEVFSAAAYGLFFGEVFSYRRFVSELVLARGEPDDGVSAEKNPVPWNFTLHPYLGFGEPSGFDFLESEEALAVQSDPEGFFIVLAGGSVAHQLAASGELEKALTASNLFPGKHPYVITLAQGAWKQPQQLIAAAYYLALGGRMNVLINLDGHNEAVDPAANAAKGIFPAYPLLWYYLASNVIPNDLLVRAGKLAYDRELRSNAAEVFYRFRLSVTAGLLWRALDRYLGSRIAAGLEALQTAERGLADTLPEYVRGPLAEIKDDETLLEFSAALWKRASLGMAAAAKAQGAAYLHFLQPNQYVPGTKVLSEEERKNAFDPQREKFVGEGYAALLEEGKDLRREGLLFAPLTGIYKNTVETVYIDTCCHVNETGNRLLAEEIVRRLAETPGLSGAGPS